MIVNLEAHRNSNNAAIEFLNIDGRIVNNEQHIADAFNNYFLSIADNINVNDNNAHTQNKYNPNSDNNIPLQSVSQIHNSPYTKIKRNPITTP